MTIRANLIETAIKREVEYTEAGHAVRVAMRRLTVEERRAAKIEACERVLENLRGRPRSEPTP